jgi:pyridoxamine 5'-phosphate oxidase
MSISDIRREYMRETFSEDDAELNPFHQFAKWWKEALDSSIDEVNAMTLATADKDGIPTARIVLLKDYNEQGFVFFTNYLSRKGREISENPHATLLFFWKELERQVRIEGTIIKVDEKESDDYFHSRPLGSKIGAWSSPQSNVISDRSVIEKNVQQYEHQFAGQSLIPRPPHWGGYRVIPSYIEFWQGRESRLHDRIAYQSEGGDTWKIQRLAP